MEKLKKFLDDGYKLVATYTLLKKTPEVKIIHDIWTKYYHIDYEFGGYSISMKQNDNIEEQIICFYFDVEMDKQIINYLFIHPLEFSQGPLYFLKRDPHEITEKFMFYAKLLLT